MAELANTFLKTSDWGCTCAGQCCSSVELGYQWKALSWQVIFSSRFRLIPGDLCQPNDQSRSLLKVIQQPCTRHELTVGDSKGGGGAVKHFVVSVVAVCLCVCWRGGGCSELYPFHPYITNAWLCTMLSYCMWQNLWDLVTENEASQDTTWSSCPLPQNTTAGKIIGVFVIVVASLLAALFCLYCWLKCRNKSLS